MGGNENPEKENVNLFLKNHEGEGSVIKNCVLMVKKLLAGVMLAGALSAAADDTSLNAVCVELQGGEKTFVLFSDNPVISAENGKLLATSKEDSTVVVGDLFSVKEITAVHWDKPTGISGVGFNGEDGPVEFYTVSGMKVDTPQKGQVYIIRQGKQTKKIIKR